MSWAEIVAGTYRDADVATAVTFTERDGTAHAQTDCLVEWRTIHGFAATGTLKTTTVPRIVIPRLTGNVKPAKSWTGTADSVPFSVAAVSEAPGHWIVEGT